MFSYIGQVLPVKHTIDAHYLMFSDKEYSRLSIALKRY